MIQVGEALRGIGLCIQERGDQDPGGCGGFDHTNPARFCVACFGCQGEICVLQITADDLINVGIGLAADAEDGMKPVVDMVREQGPGDVSPVIDDHIIGSEQTGMMAGQGAFVAARDERHIIGQLVLQAIQAADQALGVGSIRGGPFEGLLLSALRQVGLAAIDGEDAMATPGSGALFKRFENGGVQITKGLGVELVTGLAHGSGRDGVGLIQGHLVCLALAPEL